MHSFLESDGAWGGGSATGSHGCLMVVKNTFWDIESRQESEARSRRRTQSADATFCRFWHSDLPDVDLAESIILNCRTSSPYSPRPTNPQEFDAHMDSLKVPLKIMDTPRSRFRRTESNVSTYAGSQSGAATPSHASMSGFDDDLDSVALEAGCYTTVFLNGLSPSWSQARLLQILDTLGFAGRFDLVAVPFDLETLAPQGKAWINAASHADASEMIEALQAYTIQRPWNGELPEVEWSEAQGQAALVEKFRNSNLMHKSFPQDMQPQVFTAGCCVEFPRPTRRLRLPKQTRTPATIRE